MGLASNAAVTLPPSPTEAKVADTEMMMQAEASDPTIADLRALLTPAVAVARVGSTAAGTVAPLATASDATTAEINEEAEEEVEVEAEEGADADDEAEAEEGFDEEEEDEVLEEEVEDEEDEADEAEEEIEIALRPLAPASTIVPAPRADPAAPAMIALRPKIDISAKDDASVVLPVVAAEPPSKSCLMFISFCHGLLF